MAGFEARAFRGCGVMTSEPFEVSDDADSVQMLTRSSQVGEFYIMSPPQVTPIGGATASAKHTCDMMIYDEEKDMHVRVQWRDALKASCAKEILIAANALPAAADDNAEANEAGGPKVATGNGEPMPLGKWYNKALKWANYNEQDNVAIGADLDQDIRIVVARPFIEHLMHNAILAVAGRETGATLFGPADMQLSVS